MNYWRLLHRAAEGHIRWGHPNELQVLLLLLSCFSRVWLCDPMDGSPPGSPVPGILQARTLEWVAIAFSNVWKWKVKVKSLSRVWLPATPCTLAYQAPPSMGFSRQEYWSGVPLPSPSHTLVTLKILQARLQQYVNCELPDVQAGFRKGRGTRDQTANIRWIIEQAREFQKNIFCFSSLTLKII